MTPESMLVVRAAASALATAFVLTPVARAASRRMGMLDVPNERSMHVVATPRSGGNAILAGILIAAIGSGSWRDPMMAALIVAMAALALLAIADARFDLPVAVRLSSQLVIAVCVVAFSRTPVVSLGFLPGGSADPLPLLLGGGAAVLWLTWMVNAYNFMDGINGLGALEAMVCGGVLALIFLARGDTAGAVMSVAIVGAAAGFLPWNLPSGSIFMGDVGSTTLGFSLALLTLRAAVSMPLLVAMLPLFPFVFDATFTLLKRWRDGERIHVAHRKHVYQRLARQGWSHAAVALLYGTIAAACGAASLVARDWAWPATLIPVTAATVLMSVLAYAVYRRGQVPGGTP